MNLRLGIESKRPIDGLDLGSEKIGGKENDSYGF
jgi:hypothetical protein